MVKDTCKQERKTQLQQAAFSRQAKRHTQKWKRTAAAAPSARRCKGQSSRQGAGETCLQDGHTPLRQDAKVSQV